ESSWDARTRVLTRTATSLSWQLLYDFGADRYALNLRSVIESLVPDSPNPQSPIPNPQPLRRPLLERRLRRRLRQRVHPLRHLVDRALQLRIVPAGELRRILLP